MSGGLTGETILFILKMSHTSHSGNHSWNVVSIHNNQLPKATYSSVNSIELLLSSGLTFKIYSPACTVMQRAFLTVWRLTMFCLMLFLTRSASTSFNYSLLLLLLSYINYVNYLFSCHLSVECGLACVRIYIYI